MIHLYILAIFLHYRLHKMWGVREKKDLPSFIRRMCKWIFQIPHFATATHFFPHFPIWRSTVRNYSMDFCSWIFQHYNRLNYTFCQFIFVCRSIWRKYFNWLRLVVIKRLKTITKPWSSIWLPISIASLSPKSEIPVNFIVLSSRSKFFSHWHFVQQ